MGDHEERPALVAKRVHARRDEAHRVHVEARIGLVEDAHARLQHRHLQDLVALLLAAREAHIDGPLEHVGVDREVLGLGAHELEEVRGRQLVLPAGLALSVERGAQERHVAHARDLDGVLEREEQPRGGALLGLHPEQVGPVEARGPLGHLVAVAARQHVGERRLARSVGTHDGVDGARVDAQVDAAEDDLVLLLELDVEVLDRKHCVSLRKRDGRARDRHHQHRLPHDLVVQIDADHGVRAHRASLLLQMGGRGVARVLELALVGARAAADHVGDLGEEVAHEVRAHDGLAHDEAVIGAHGAALDGVGGGDDHVTIPIVRCHRRQAKSLSKASSAPTATISIPPSLIVIRCSRPTSLPSIRCSRPSRRSSRRR